MNKWLDICFDMAEGYAPRDKDSYNEGYHLRERFLGISNHVAAVTNYFVSAHAEKPQQERTIYMFLYLGIGYSAVGDYESSMENKTKALRLQEKHLDDSHPLTATIYMNVATAYNDKGRHAERWSGIERYCQSWSPFTADNISTLQEYVTASAEHITFGQNMIQLLNITTEL